MKYVCAIVAVLVSGCVTQGTYDALQRDRDAIKADLDRCAADDAGCHEAVRGLNDKIARLSAKLETVTRQKEALEGDKSAMLKDKSRLQASIDEMKTALEELSRRKAEADARLNEFRALIGRFKSLIDAGKLQVKIVDGRMVVALASDVLFASGSAKLSENGKGAIGEVAKILADIAGRKFQVEGHTDNVPMKSAQYPSNWELAAARALTVVKAMVDAGMPPDRISAASFGEFKPAKPNDSPEGKGANRRIEIVVVPDLSSLPGFDELQKAGQ